VSGDVFSLIKKHEAVPSSIESQYQVFYSPLRRELANKGFGDCFVFI